MSGLLRQFKSDRLSGLLLSYRCAIRRVSACGDILDLDRDDVTAAKLAVDRQIEHGKIANATLDLEFRPDRPDMFRAQRRLCPGSLPLFQGRRLIAAVVFSGSPMVLLLRYSERDHHALRVKILDTNNLKAE